MPAPRTAYARVFVTVPGKFEGQYFGLYSMTEAVDKHFAERHFGTKRGQSFGDAVCATNSHFNQHGYIYAVVRPCGTCNSGGEVEMFTPRDGSDGKMIVDGAEEINGLSARAR